MTTLNSELIEEIVRRVSGAVHPLRVILFGSAARGEMGPASDVDLLIVMPDGITGGMQDGKFSAPFRDSAQPRM